MAFDFSDRGKKPVVENIVDWTKANENFRTTVWTGEKLQMTLMTIEPDDEMGLEVHKGIDQLYVIVSGNGTCQVGPAKDNFEVETEISEFSAVFVPANMWHNIINKGSEPLKMYTLYSDTDHLPGTVHKTREEAENDPNEQH
ncbi:cupin domain-containing protein [Facklamia sp. DSM 111018]|uniref:Cupin domain-containing protein n=1 Tax=Facklamia lactis TaxID=2749967 RepID=A0ABS0LRB1_9LACT|nr:cupin domain-containing protein [Facklamia lactis]MBG9980949.1 cupin domain-containing protein [Facklamia lactis]MBG9986688.1 cupin domain-containing protein [Facklamia lactis]